MGIEMCLRQKASGRGCSQYHVRIVMVMIRLLRNMKMTCFPILSGPTVSCEKVMNTEQRCLNEG